MEESVLKCCECGSDVPKGSWKYCSRKCMKRAVDRRRNRNRDQRMYLRAWRRNNYRLGLCSRCGHENPEHEHYKTCPECRDRVRLC